MLHRPAQLLCILSGFYRSMPLLFQIKGRHIMAHLLSGYTYPHVLYAFQYSVVSLLLRSAGNRNMTTDCWNTYNLHSMVCGGHAVPSFRLAPFIIVTGKYAKNLPIYQNFFNFFVSVDNNAHIGFEQPACAG